MSLVGGVNRRFKFDICIQMSQLPHLSFYSNADVLTFPSIFSNLALQFCSGITTILLFIPEILRFGTLNQALSSDSFSTN